MSDFDSTSITGSDSGFRVTELFGGAMTCLLPGSFEDISQYRPVPDHQEVFVDKNSNSSIMIEILAREEDVPSSTGAGALVLTSHTTQCDLLPNTMFVY